METFAIDAYSGTTGTALWAEEWKCLICDNVMSPSTVDFDTHCPLHNPMRCTGRGSGDRHVGQPCNPLSGAEVFILHLDDDPYTSRRTVVGRIPSRRY